ncbi:Nucleoside-diphosphate-sugar epimerase [Lachnospiraceae bacterium]|nr:Nucleoside-diphosphate-sugar epimerase [Lachnospiraceae bacterium]
MKILVTGGTGFIGGYFVPMLLNKGYEVRLLVRNIENAKSLFGDKCEYHIGDVTQKDSLKGCCDGIDIVFHLVAKSGNDLPNEKNFKIYRDINVVGTQNLLSECKHIKKFIYISSTAAMGLVKENPISEKSKCKPYLPYQVTKYEVEKLLRRKAQKGFPVIIVRPTKVYGINEPNYSYLTLAKLVKKGLFIKIGKGHNYTSNIYVTDFAQALVNLVEYGIIGETYIVTSKKSIDFIDSGKIIAKTLGVKLRMIRIPARIMILAAAVEERLFILLKKNPIVTKRNIEMTINDRIYDISKAEKDIKFSPEVSMEQGIKTVINWYKEKGLI